ncbi:MAG TPA: hypothetical protein VGF29_06935 [Hyphomicrobiaceae bacterium]|jgi:hypothetical protein
MFGGGGRSALPPPPAPPPPDTSATDVQQEMAAERARLRARRGRTATQLTGSLGGSLLNEPTGTALGGNTGVAGY